MVLARIDIEGCLARNGAEILTIRAKISVTRDGASKTVANQNTHHALQTARNRRNVIGTERRRFWSPMVDFQRITAQIAHVLSKKSVVLQNLASSTVMIRRRGFPQSAKKSHRQNKKDVYKKIVRKFLKNSSV